ncbi:MAG: hypothetical protein ACFUZC_17055 [Chthoniobacteraceae bacterium]
MNETSSITPEMASRVLEANWKNLVKKVAAGRTLSGTELALLKSRAASSQTTVAFAKDVTDLARILGVTRQTVYAWIKRKGAPEALPDGTFDIVAWRQFIQAKGFKGAAAPDPEALKARKLLAEIEDRELKVALKRGDYVLLSEVRCDWLTQVGKAIALLRAKFENELPPILSGQDAQSIREECALAIDEVCKVLHTGGGNTP